MTVHGRVAHVSHALFRAYYESVSLPLRQIIAHLVRRFLPDPIVQTAGMPSFGRVTVTAQPGRRMVHLLAYVPERRGTSIDMIEDPIEVRDVSVSLRADGLNVSHVCLAPCRTPLPFKVHQDHVTVTVPVVPGCAMVMFEQ